MKILLVYNQYAGNQRARKLLPQIEDTFNKQGISFDLAISDYPEHGRDIVREAELSKYDGLVAAGGDGTLFEVVNGLYNNPSSKKIPIGVVPIGTGNAFVRDMDLKTDDFKKAIAIIKQNKPRKVDVGKFTSHGQVYYFMNILGLGFVADVGETAHKLKFFGNLSYTLGVLYQTLFLQATQMTVETEKEKYTLDCTFVEVSNTRYTANFLMAPNAVNNDGLLDITIAKKLGRIKLLQSFPKILTGDHIHMDEVITLQAKSIKIKSKKPKILTPDGELMGITPIEIECLKRDVDVFWV